MTSVEIQWLIFAILGFYTVTWAVLQAWRVRLPTHRPPRHEWRLDDDDAYAMWAGLPRVGGTLVIQTKGLPDGYVPPSASLRAPTFCEEYSDPGLMDTLTGREPKRKREPAYRSTGIPDQHPLDCECRLCVRPRVARSHFDRTCDHFAGLPVSPTVCGPNCLLQHVHLG